MESKDKIPLADTNRRDFLKRATLGVAAVLVSPVIGIAEKISPSKLKEKIKYEQFVLDQVNKIKEIIIEQRYDEILSNPYLVYCLYYSRTFLGQISDPKNQEYVSEKIIGSVAHLVTPEFQAQVILALEKQTRNEESLKNKRISTNEIMPLKSFDFGKGENHEGAVDLFTDELSPVYGMGSGLVVVAENGWSPDDESSTSSIRGGNTVIVFNYLTEEFYRYAHLDRVVVSPGELIMEGETLGTVGHTGKTASLPGHGQHLHLEIRKYLGGKNKNQSPSTNELKKQLKNLKYTT